MGRRLLLISAALAACSQPLDRPELSRAAIVHGDDDRREFFDVRDAPASLLAGSVVALLPRKHLSDFERTSLSAPTWAEAEGLCAQERFAEQPAAALCSGVLVDWDLVLTAGHCLRQVPLADLFVAFNYHYAAEGALALRKDDVYRAVEIVSEVLDPPQAEARLDFAWVRIDRPARFPKVPAAVSTSPTDVRSQENITVVATPGGVPLKWDLGAHIQEIRATARDYFLADSDTSHGSSGAGAFNREGVLLGVFSRGAPDLVTSPAGCQITIREPDARVAEEAFTYASRAVETLCRTGGVTSSLCRPDCGNPCAALPLPPDAGGCAIGLSGRLPSRSPAVLGIVGLILAMARRMSRRPRPDP